SASCNGAINGFNAWMSLSSTVTVAGGVTINGPGKSNFAVSAVFTSGNVFYSPGALTINDLGVKYAHVYNAASATYGGCIHAKGDLTLTNVKTLNCNGAWGGGLAGGGGVSARGAVNAPGSDLINSYAKPNTSTVRGGAFFPGTTATLTNSNV